MSKLSEFGKTARGLARNPLGIIALFIVLIYGFASLVVGLSGQLQRTERLLIVCFLVAFPVMVLGVFAWLVSRHHTKLYAPTDFRADDSFVQLAERRARFAAGFAAATARHVEDRISEEASTGVVETEDAVAVAERTVTPDTVRVAQSRQILWVDDRPLNNTYERQALEALGFHVATATATDEALRAMRRRVFDVIISDMGRPPDDRAGYTLLREIRRFDQHVPFLIYSSSSTPEQRREARSQGAQGATHQPGELIEMVVGALRTTR